MKKIIDRIIDTKWFDTLYQLDQCKQYVTLEVSYELCVALLMLQCNQHPDIEKVDQMIRNIKCNNYDLEKWIIFDSIPNYTIESIRDIINSHELITNKSLFWLLYDTVSKIRKIIKQVKTDTFVSITES